MIEANQRKVLIMGSSTSEIAVIRNGLVADGCQVRVSETAETALAESIRWKPEMVIADDSFADFIGTLRRICTDIPVLIRSQSRTQFVALLNGGADDCVEKTCSVAELRARIRSKLKHSRRFVGTKTGREG